MLNVPLMWFMGQSNGLGANPDGSAALPSFPAYANYTGYKANRGLRPASLGIDGAGAGSPLYHLLHRWFEITGQRALGLMSNEGGTGLLQAAGGNGTWAVGAPASLYESASLQMQRMAEGVRLSPAVSISRVHVQWCLGEQDSSVYNGTTVTGELHQAALQVLHDRAIADVQAAGLTFGRFCVYQSGYRASDPTNAGWAAIRQAQADFVAANPETAIMAFDKAKEQGALVVDGSGDWVSGWGLMDDVHYTAAAWRAMGRGGAANLAAAEGLI